MKLEAELQRDAHPTASKIAPITTADISKSLNSNGVKTNIEISTNSAVFQSETQKIVGNNNNLKSNSSTLNSDNSSLSKVFESPLKRKLQKEAIPINLVSSSDSENERAKKIQKVTPIAKKVVSKQAKPLKNAFQQMDFKQSPKKKGWVTLSMLKPQFVLDDFEECDAFRDRSSADELYFHMLSSDAECSCVEWCHNEEFCNLKRTIKAKFIDAPNSYQFVNNKYRVKYAHMSNWEYKDSKDNLVFFKIPDAVIKQAPDSAMKVTVQTKFLKDVAQLNQKALLKWKMIEKERKFEEKETSKGFFGNKLKSVEIFTKYMREFNKIKYEHTKLLAQQQNIIVANNYNMQIPVVVMAQELQKCYVRKMQSKMRILKGMYDKVMVSKRPKKGKCPCMKLEMCNCRCKGHREFHYKFLIGTLAIEPILCQTLNLPEVFGNDSDDNEEQEREVFVIDENFISMDESDIPKYKKTIESEAEKSKIQIELQGMQDFTAKIATLENIPSDGLANGIEVFAKMNGQNSESPVIVNMISKYMSDSNHIFKKNALLSVEFLSNDEMPSEQMQIVQEDTSDFANPTPKNSQGDSALINNSKSNKPALMQSHVEGNYETANFKQSPQEGEELENTHSESSEEELLRT